MSVESPQDNEGQTDQKMVNGEQRLNGMSNGHAVSSSEDTKQKSSSSSHHKSSSKDKYKDRERDKDREKDRDKDRSKDHKSSSSKSSHRDKDRDKEKDKDREKDKERDKNKHSSSNGKDRHSSSHKSSNRDKDREKDKERDKDKDRNREKDKERDKNRDRDRDKDKSKSSSSKDKDKDREDKDKKSSSSSHRDKEKDKERSEKSSRDKEKDKERSDKDKDRSKDYKSSSSKDKDKSSSSKDKHHSSSSGSKHKSKDKDRDRERDKDKDRHREKDRDKHSSSKDKKSDREKRIDPVVEIIKMEIDAEPDIKPTVEPKFEMVTIPENLDISQNSSCDYSLSQFKEEYSDPIVKDEQPEFEEEEDVEMKEEPDDDYAEAENGEEEDDDDDVPLSKRKKEETDSDEDDAPLTVRKKAKTEKSKKKKRKEESEEEDDDEYSDDYKPKKKIKQENKPKPKPNNNKKVKQEQSSPQKGRKKKEDQEEQEVWKWWEEEKKTDGTKWNFLEHKGPLFAPPYERLPSNVRLRYNGKEMKLSEDAEEVAGFYARLVDHEYTSKKAFNDNFFSDWRKTMTKDEKEQIQDLHKCDFRQMTAFFASQSEKNRNRSKEEKKELKEKNEAIAKEYGICIIDGHKEKVGNFRIEPPGLFRGRGEHPKMGKLKKRVVPEDVIINCSKTSSWPQPPKGHKWKEVRHDNTVSWLASWTENVQGQVKYVMLNPSSKLKGEKDYMKYETARKLQHHIDKIRKTYTEEWKSKEMRIRQRAVALYFIDKLALRAGNEKDEDQADTVGCCSLRVEHVALHKELNGKENVVVFDFLGKDSIRYYNEVEVEKRVFKNLELFRENKKKGDDLFDRLNTQVMNEHLKDLMDGLTAKVFRTYNASSTLQNQLDLLTEPDMTVPEKLLAYNRANRAVAILCNHQRAVPKTHGKSMENLQKKISDKREAIEQAEQEYRDAKRDRSARGQIEKSKKEKLLERLRDQLKKLEIQETDKDENKTIALGTSKLNYLDPRISVAWCKKWDVPIEKIFNKTQRDKFRWAIEMADENYRFLTGSVKKEKKAKKEKHDSD